MYEVALDIKDKVPPFSTLLGGLVMKSRGAEQAMICTYILVRGGRD